MSAPKILLALAAVQLALIPVTWRRPDDTPRGSHPVLEVDADAITAIRVESSGDDPDSVLLQRTDDGWVVASAGNYPAESDKVDTLLEKLSGITVAGDAIASQVVSYGALGVGDREFGRRVTVESADRSTVVTVGRSDTGGLNVRTGDGPDVFAGRGASEWDLSASPGNYVDRELVSVERDAARSILVENDNGTISVTRNGDNWLPDVVPFGRVPDDSGISRLVGAVTTVRMTEPVAAPAGAFAGRVVRATWAAEGDDGPTTGTVEIGAETEGYRYVRLAGDTHVVLVSTSSLRPILDASPMTLTKAPEP